MRLRARWRVEAPGLSGSTSAPSRNSETLCRLPSRRLSSFLGTATVNVPRASAMANCTLGPPITVSTEGCFSPVSVTEPTLCHVADFTARACCHSSRKLAHSSLARAMEARRTEATPITPPRCSLARNAPTSTCPPVPSYLAMVVSLGGAGAAAGGVGWAGAVEVVCPAAGAQSTASAAMAKAVRRIMWPLQSGAEHWPRRASLSTRGYPSPRERSERGEGGAAQRRRVGALASRLAPNFKKAPTPDSSPPFAARMEGGEPPTASAYPQPPHPRRRLCHHVGWRGGPVLTMFRLLPQRSLPESGLAGRAQWPT